MRFTKMHGAGNDYVYVDGFRDKLPSDPAKVAVAVSDRHKGIGADGLILICPSDVADAEMRMFNADGSASEMCGNGIRCVAKYLFDHGIVASKSLSVNTGDGVKQLEVFTSNGTVESVRVDMGIPQLDAARVPTLIEPNDESRVIEAPFEVDGTHFAVTCVSMGNPHCVIFDDAESDSNLSADESFATIGQTLESHPLFPARVNVEIVTVRSRDEVHQRTWERGSGETMACGTGASAVCVAGVLTGRTGREVRVHLKGGMLYLEWDAASNHVFMTGPATEVFRGEIDT